MILVIVAHPDDESLFMGGTIATLRNAGERVIVVVLSDGVGSRCKWWQWFKRWGARAERADAFKAACKRLDVEGLLLRVFPDQRADSRDQLDINKAVEKVIADANPYEVYTHWRGDLNKDHRIVAEAVTVATRPDRTKYVRKVYAMQPEYPELSMSPWVPTVTNKLEDWALRRKTYACCAYWMELRSPKRRDVAQDRFEAFMEIR
jgi:LmbE family N-acetylglucosaminyl deacetylase